MKTSASAGQAQELPASFKDFPGLLEWLGVTGLAVISACRRMIRCKLSELLLVSIAALQGAACSTSETRPSDGLLALQHQDSRPPCGLKQ